MVCVLCLSYCVPFHHLLPESQELLRVSFLHLRVSQGSGTLGRGKQDAGKGTFGTGDGSGTRILRPVVPGPEGVEGWRPVISLFEFERLCHPHQIQDRHGFLVLRSVRKGDVMFPIDLKDACFHIPVYLESP